jgi:glycosyltransferase involved in cell wall biosynthesis
MSEGKTFGESIHGLVSVVIPTHNRSFLLQRSIFSVMSQSYQNIEIIVVDDHSEDDTKEVVSSFTDSRIVYLKSQRRGRSHARNLGISVARGEFLAFLDDDDVYEKDKIKLQLELARSNPGFCFFIGKSLLKDHHEVILDDSGIQDLDLNALRRSFLPGTVMLPSLFIRIHGNTNFYFDADMNRFEDLDFYRRYMGDSLVLSHKDIVATVYTHPGNTLNQQMATDIIQQLRIYRRKISYLNPISRKGMSLLYTYYGDALIKLPGFYVRGLWFLTCAVFLQPEPFRISRLKVLVSIFKHSVKRLIMKVLPVNNRYLSKLKFSVIYRYKLFGVSESASGPGSDLVQTHELMAVLPEIFSQLEVKSLADAPCGDFFWMSKLDLSRVEYNGYDIVPKLIKANRNNFPHQNFHQLDITRQSFRCHDLILCRDLLVHLDFQDIFRVLKNFQLSGSKYILTTTFPLLQNNQNLDQKIWRPLNLEIEPFNLGNPIEIISERTTEDPRYADKSLGLWKISDINFPP